MTTEHTQLADNVGGPAASGQFPLQARRDLRLAFAYLRAPERGDYYQAIVRIFLKNARRYYKIYLTVEQVATDLAALYVDYTVDKCRSDLEQLTDWGNVVRTYDTAQRHTTIDSFLHPTVLYRATPATLEIEEMYLRLEQQSESMGELRRGDLDHLLELFQRVDDLIRVLRTSRRDGGDRTGGQDLAETWRRLADQAGMILDNTSKYIHTLAIARQEAATSEIEGYLRYKQQVVEYVQDFAMALERVSAQLQRLFRAWEADGSREHILAALAEYSPTPFLAVPSLDERRADAASQIGAVTDWFHGPEWVDYFGRAARSEVNAVLQRAQLLAATVHLGAGFLTDLETLARKLLRLSDVEEAAGIAAVAFGYRGPRLLPEHLSASAADASEPWIGVPTVSLTLQSIQRNGAIIHDPPAPVRDRAATDLLRQAELARRRERLERLDRLFGQGEREITALPLADDRDAALVVEVTRQCLFAVGNQWRADDGSTIAMLNPNERGLALVRARGGWYILPRYRFNREVRARSFPEVRGVV